MTETQKQKILVSLTEAIDQWSEDVCEDEDLWPHSWGDEYARWMATAAVAVMEGMAGQEMYLERERGFKQ